VGCGPPQFDRGLAYGKRLNVPAGSSVRFEPGDKKTVTLVEIAGNKVRAARGSLEQCSPGLSCS
jgi:urease beta subunit